MNLSQEQFNHLLVKEMAINNSLDHSDLPKIDDDSAISYDTMAKVEAKEKTDNKSENIYKNLKLLHFKKLAEKILPLSESDNFDEAKHEWEIDHIEKWSQFGNCACGHAIKEHIFIRNKNTNKMTHVGNECINIFVNVKKGLFTGMQEIEKDQKNAVQNTEVIEHVYQKGYIYNEEYDFLHQIIKRKKRKNGQTWSPKSNRHSYSPKKLKDLKNTWLPKINWRIVNKKIVRYD